MPLLLLIPLLLVAVLLLWALALPFTLWQRYRSGKARRRAQPWVVRVNAWLLLASALLFLPSAWFSGHWIAGALAHAAIGMGLGVVLGLIGLWITRFETTPQGTYYTPNAWLALALTTLVALRIGLGLWQTLQRWHAAAPLPVYLADHASLFSVAGLLLGYYLSYAWTLKRRLA